MSFAKPPLYRVLVALSLVLLGFVAWLSLRSPGRVPAPDYAEVEEHLYIGAAVSRPPPHTRSVVNLCEHQDPYKVETALWEPLDGNTPPSIDWLRRVVTFIDTQRKAGKTTYVHCRSGINRSGMVVVAYLMFEQHWSRDRALAFVQSKRPEVQPNPIMWHFLLDWERTVTEQR